MIVELKDISKRYLERWIIRNCRYVFNSGIIYGIKGPNGSGKSTLIKIISGYLSPTKGQVLYKQGFDSIDRDDIFRHIALCTPYLAYPRQLSLEEVVDFVMSFRSFSRNRLKSEFFTELGPEYETSKRLGDLSSGQWQRFHLALALWMKSSMILFDEPTSFLDSQAKSWFKETLLSEYGGRLVIIASNDPEDLKLCTDILDLSAGIQERVSK